ncbi:hypothetical protein FB451DRAFT_1485158 [Mycena latifolia]|nr:hypothetical protein FB451DRAFT_1485158 [Mycena latifolia]
MLQRFSNPEPRLNAIIAWLTPALTLLDEIHDGCGTPFIQAISSTTLSLISIVQNAKRNRDKCLELIENIHTLLYGIVHLHLKSEPKGSLSPAVLDHVGDFSKTLQRILLYVEAQQDGNKFKNFFRKTELARLLEDCHIGLTHASKIFKIQSEVINFSSINEMKAQTESMHTEIMELISTFSDCTISDASSSIFQWPNETHISSNSLSILPSAPKIFHGRESEVGEIVAESVKSKIELATLMALHVGLRPAKDIVQKVVQHFSKGLPCLLVLDNLETAWEPMNSRGDVEEFLSLLTDIQHLALIITMRGAERPGKVCWTRPFLRPLQPLSDGAARKTFVDITDNSHDSNDISRLLSLTDNMPLAVDLIANLVDYEGCNNVLARWETEKTSIFSSGNGRRSNLDESISISLSSPRLTASSGAKELLSLLSILPDGLSDSDLHQSNLPAKDILACKAVLLRTALAYIDTTKNRLKVLVPIREYMQHHYPASPSFVKCLSMRFYDLLNFWGKYKNQQSGASLYKQLVPNLANIQNVLMLELRSDNPHLENAMHSAAILNNLQLFLGHGPIPCADFILKNYSQPQNPRLEVHMITLLFRLYRVDIENVDHLVSQAENDFDHFDDPSLKCRFYDAVGRYFFVFDNIPRAIQFFTAAQKLAASYKDSGSECSALLMIGHIEKQDGKYSAAKISACRVQKLAKLDANVYFEAHGLHLEAVICNTVGDYRLSIPLCNWAKELYSLCGFDQLEYDALGTMAETYYRKSEYAEAREIYKDMENAISDQKLSVVHALAFLGTAEVDIRISESTDHIPQIVDNAKRIIVAKGSSDMLVRCDIILANLEFQRGNAAMAKLLLCQSLKTGCSKGMITSSLEGLASLKNWGVSNIDWVSGWATIYLGYALKYEDKFATHQALCNLGNIFMADGDLNTALGLFTVALGGFTWMDVHRSRAECMLRLGEISQQRGRAEEAIAFWKAARPLFERSSQAKDVAHIDTLFLALSREQKHTKHLAHLITLNAPNTLVQNQTNTPVQAVAEGI